MFALRPAKFGARNIARYCARAHGLIFTRLPERIRAVPDGAVWRASTGVRDYVIKLFLPERWQRVRTEVDIMEFLRARDICTPLLLHDCHDQAVGLIAPRWLPLPSRRGCPIIVIALEPGRQVEVGTATEEEIGLIGCSLARMHHALRRYPQPGCVPALEYLGPHMGSFDDLGRGANGRTFPATQLAQWQNVDRRMEQVVASARRIAPSVRSVLHGDVGLENIRLLEGRHGDATRAYFFDFSDYCRGPVIFELAIALSRLYWEGEVTFARWEALRTWLLEAYASVFPLPEADWRALDAVLIERLLIEVRYLNRTAVKTGAPFEPRGVAKRYALGAYLLTRRLERPVEALPAQHSSAR